MIEKELYIDVLEYLQDGGNWSQKLEIVEINSYKEIGNFIISKLTENNNIRVITVGNLAKKIAEKVAENGIPTASFENNCQATRYILENVEKNSTIFLKASRSMKFEEILNELKGEISW